MSQPFTQRGSVFLEHLNYHPAGSSDHQGCLGEGGTRSCIGMRGKAPVSLRPFGYQPPWPGTSACIQSFWAGLCFFQTVLTKHPPVVLPPPLALFVAFLPSFRHVFPLDSPAESAPGVCYRRESVDGPDVGQDAMCPSRGWSDEREGRMFTAYPVLGMWATS